MGILDVGVVTVLVANEVQKIMGSKINKNLGHCSSLKMECNSVSFSMVVHVITE